MVLDMAFGHRLFHHVNLVLVLDIFLDGTRIDENFGSRYTPLAILCRQKTERNNASQDFGQQQTHFVVLVRRIHRKHTVDSFHGIRRMDGRKDHVARIGSGQRNLHRLKVTDFAHEEHVRILTESGTERIRVRKRIHTDFALRDNGYVVFIKIFDRVFDGNDVD